MTGLSAVHQALLDSVPLPDGATIRDDVVRYDHDGLALEGYVAWDDARDGRRPAVLVVHDWSGLREYPKARAQMLARLGYVGFAADVYGAGRRFEDDDASAAEAGKYYGDL